MFIDLNTIQRQWHDDDDDGDTLFFDMKEIVFFATLPAKKKEEEEEWMLRVHVSFSLFVKSYCVRVGG